MLNQTDTALSDEASQRSGLLRVSVASTHGWDWYLGTRRTNVLPKRGNCCFILMPDGWVPFFVGYLAKIVDAMQAVPYVRDHIILATVFRNVTTYVFGLGLC